MAVGINPAWFGTQASSTSSDGGATAKEKFESLSIYGDGGGTSSKPTQYKPPTGSTTVTMPIAPKEAAPTLGEMPDLPIPAFNEELYKEETRKAVSAPLRSLRRQTREALTRHIDTTNPALKREYYRAALRGHGEALSSIFGQAQVTGRAAAEKQRDIEFAAARDKFQGQMQMNSLKFQAAMQAYMAKFGQTSTQKYQYDSTSGSGGGTRLVPTMVGAVSGMATGYRRV